MSSYARVYDFSIPAGGTIFLEVPGDYYKIISSTGNIGTRRDGSNLLQPMFAGRGEKGAEFQRLALADLSGSTNTGQILIASGAEMVDSTFQMIGAVSVRPESPSGNFTSRSANAANTPDAIFTPAANVNGAIVYAAGMAVFNNTTLPNAAFLAKNAAPATPIDGDLILLGLPAVSYGGFAGVQATMPSPQYIPAGLGLYFIADQALNAGTQYSARHCRWKML